MITITQSKRPSVIPVVISSPFTCQFNLITATHLYSLYPKLLSGRETVRGMAPVFLPEFQRLAERGVQLVTPNAEWTIPCGEVCLPVWRRTEALDGAGIMQWGGYNESRHGGRSDQLTMADNINFSNHKWRLGLHCSNSSCQNSKNSTLI